MRKGFLTVLAVVLVAAMAAPAMATDLSTSGFIRIKEHVEQNYGASAVSTSGTVGTLGTGGFILPQKDASTASYVEQRMRFIFDWKGENVGARYYGELDYTNWGDSAYNTARNQGGGLEADTVNLESKNIYMWFTIPNTSLKVTAGMQNQSDSFGGMIFGYADMAGFFLTGNLEPLSYKLGVAKFQENLTKIDDDVDLYVAELKFAPVKEARLGLDFYMIRDASGNKTTFNTGQTNLNTILRGFSDYGYAPLLGTYDPSTFFYVGLDGSINAGPVGLSGYAFYNGGKIKKVSGTIGTATLLNQDVDVKAWAADLRADANLGPGKFFLEGAYVSGTGSNDNNSSADFKSPITASNYALAASYPLTSMDMQILFPNGDDITASNALAYDVQNKGRGIIAVAAGFSMKFTDMLAGKVGIGYLTDAKNFIGVNSTGVSIKKHKATEINANVNYALQKGLDIGLYGAYAFLSDWESYGTALGTATATPVDLSQKADNIYKAMFRMNYAF
jgi:hypothetical protein